MGEVDPRRAGVKESQLAKNRRAEFTIVHRYSPLDVLPQYGEDILLPWSGEPAKVKKPEDIDLKMKHEQERREQQRDSEGLRDSQDIQKPEKPQTPDPKPAPPPVKEGKQDPDDPEE